MFWHCKQSLFTERVAYGHIIYILLGLVFLIIIAEIVFADSVYGLLNKISFSNIRGHLLFVPMSKLHLS